MKKLILVLFIFLGYSSYAQKIFEVGYAYQADVKVYITNTKHEADWIVKRVDYAYQANKRGLWYIVDYVYQADIKVYVVDYPYQADRIVYFTRNEWETKMGL